MTASGAVPQGPCHGNPIICVPDPLSFLHNDSKMTAAIRAHDWSLTSLGAPERWPQPLRTVIKLMLNSRQPMYVFWGKEHICFYNDAYSTYIGPERHPHSLGRPGQEVWEEIWDVIGPQIELVMSTGGGTWHENHLVPITRHGAREDVYWTYGYSPIDDEASLTGIGGVLVVCTDTTKHVLAERRQAEYAAMQAADRDRVWRNSRDLLVVMGFDGVVRAVNPAVETMLGYAPDEVVGKSFMDFIWPEDAALTQADLRAVAANNKPAYSENRYRHNDGTLRWISWHTTAEGESIYAYGRDVTRRKRAQDELEVAHEALRHAQKMEAIGQLTGGIAHDFNNMLQGVMGGITFAERRIAGGRPHEAQKFLDAAREGAIRASLLTQRLLGFGRRQALDPKSVTLGDLIRRMAELIKRTVGPSITVSTEVPEDCWPVLCDPNQLENALLNLAINARDAMLPKGGTLTIHVMHNVLEAADVAGWEGASPGEYVRITVSDTGAGMPPEVLARAFDPFFTTKPMGQGTGLGLSQIYGFVRQSGGVVRLESAIGAGTSVNLDLPRSLSKTEAQAATAFYEGVVQPARDAGATVLLVEDEAGVREILAETLRELGYRIFEAGDAAAALKLLHGPEGQGIELLISDVGLPGGLNGRQLADAAREISAGLPVLLITGYMGDALGGELEQGMEVLTKPFELETLARRIQAMAGRVKT